MVKEIERQFQLFSYISPGAPATRRRACGPESNVRAEIGFTPAWYRQHLEIDFGRRWHTDPSYRNQAVLLMRDELRQRFPGTSIGNTNRPFDILTGTYGACTVAAVFDIPIVYAENNWPNCKHAYLSDQQVDALETPDLDTNPFFCELMSQVEWIAEHHGRIEGYINFQGVLNNAYRLRGQQLFADMLDTPDRARRVFECVCNTMIEGARRLYTRQRASGVDVDFLTVSNCLVNMISPAQYSEFLLPLDCRIAKVFGCIGIHNCAWKADPYFDHYAKVPNLAYIDMGADSDLDKARRIFPNARRAIMYNPVDLAEKSAYQIEADFAGIAEKYGPCDIVLADIEAQTPDERIWVVLEICKGLC
jgi:hypothetical protein